MDKGAGADTLRYCHTSPCTSYARSCSLYNRPTYYRVVLTK